MGIRLLLPGVGDSIEGFEMMEWVGIGVGVDVGLGGRTRESIDLWRSIVLTLH